MSIGSEKTDSSSRASGAKGGPRSLRDRRKLASGPASSGAADGCRRVGRFAAVGGEFFERLLTRQAFLDMVLDGLPLPVVETVVEQALELGKLVEENA